jgi:ABC-type sugar transport system permease subunit
MTVQSATRAEGLAPEFDPRTHLRFRILGVWHTILCLAALGAAAWLWTSGGGLAGWLRILATVLLMLASAASGAVIPLLLRRHHMARVLSLAVNYLLFLLLFFGVLHLLGVFTGIDALAGTFGRGLPFLATALVGYGIGAFADRYGATQPRRYRAFKRISQSVMGLSGAAFLVALGLFPGLAALAVGLLKPLPLAMTGGMIVLGVMLWMMWSSGAARMLGAKQRDDDLLSGYMFLSPNLLGFLFFFAGPLLFSLAISFTNSDGFGNQEWIGLQNYLDILNLSVARLASAAQPVGEVLNTAAYSELLRVNVLGNSYVLGAQDKLFWISLGNTVRFMLMAVPLSIVPALFLAAVLNSRMPGMKTFRAIYFLPSIAAVVGVATIWKWLYNSTVGWLNYLITAAITGINGLVNAPLITDPKIGWLSDTDVALLAVVIIVAWRWIGFNTVLFLAGLKNIPGELYEAATVDGANPWQRFWSITLPLLAPTTFFVVATTVVQAMQVFDEVFVLTNPPGGPGTSTMTIVLYMYQNGFKTFRQGYGAAVAWTLFVLIFTATFLQFLRQRRSSAGVYDV